LPDDARKSALSRARIVAAAIRLIDANGLDALTMRALADELGASPMAPYRYYANRQALLGACAEHLLGSSMLEPDHDDDGIAQLRRIVTDFRRLATAHPFLAQVIAQRAPSAPVATVLINRVLAALLAAGLSRQQATHGLHAVSAFVNGYHLIETRGFLRPTSQLAGYLATEPIAATSAGGPAAQCRRLLEDLDEDFNQALDYLLAGLKAQAGVAGG
jgi:AcrR family transcriptional regulator